MVRDGEREAVPVLIDLLAVASDEQVGQLEDVLSQLAGETAPETAWSGDDADKKKCRDAWAAWWKNNGESVDLTRLTARPWYGYTLLCDSSRNRVFEIDRNGKERWAINGIPFPVDAWVIGGKHVLIAEYSGRKITERDFNGKVIWSKAVCKNLPVNVQRLPNGHTFIATLNQIVEVDRNGKEMYAINNIVGGITAAYRARDGRIICVARNGGQCIITGHDRQAPQAVRVQSHGGLDERHRFTGQRPHSHHAAQSQQGGGVRPRRQIDRRGRCAAGDDGDGSAQWTFPYRQHQRPARLRGGSQR